MEAVSVKPCLSRLCQVSGYRPWFTGYDSTHAFRPTALPAYESGLLTALRTFDRVRYVTWLMPIVHAVANNWSRAALSRMPAARGTVTALAGTTYPQLIAVVEQMRAQDRGSSSIRCARCGTGSGTFSTASGPSQRSQRPSGLEFGVDLQLELLLSLVDAVIADDPTEVVH